MSSEDQLRDRCQYKLHTRSTVYTYHSSKVNTLVFCKYWCQFFRSLVLLIFTRMSLNYFNLVNFRIKPFIQIFLIRAIGCSQDIFMFQRNLSHLQRKRANKVISGLLTLTVFTLIKCFGVITRSLRDILITKVLQKKH